MRTPLAWKLRVTISPWISVPDFLKEPMLAMSYLLAVFEPATTAASMAICRPEAISDAPLADGTQWRTGARNFLGAARNGRHAQGKKVLRRRCGQTIEAQPAFGQIKPLRGRVVRA
jgi:hypothetical protein